MVRRRPSRTQRDAAPVRLSTLVLGLLALTLLGGLALVAAASLIARVAAP